MPIAGPSACLAMPMTSESLPLAIRERTRDLQPVSRREHCSKWLRKLTIRYGDGKERILARPKAPPIVRKKLRAPVTTARSFFADVAWAATRVVWNVSPIPTPSMMRYPMINEVEISGEKVVCKPNPTVQITNPAQMAGLYLPVLDS
jgi:hypothetical protein